MKFKNHEDVVKYISESPDLIPESLLISDLKWRYLIRSVISGNNILMTGPSGCGKTMAAMSMRNIFDDRKFFSFNLGATQDARSTLIGNTHFSKSSGTFVSEALFVKAIQTPNAIILLDELSRAHYDAVNILMTVLDPEQRYLRIDEHPETPTIQVADGVCFIGTANIGAEYTATRVIDRAVLDRFRIIEMDVLSENQETSLLSNRFPDVAMKDIQAISEIAHHTRVVLKGDDPILSTIISTRQTVEMVSLLNDGFTLSEVAVACIYPYYSNAGGMDSERTYMKQIVQRYIEVDPDSDTPWSTTSEFEDEDTTSTALPF